MIQMNKLDYNDDLRDALSQVTAATTQYYQKLHVLKGWKIDASKSTQSDLKVIRSLLQLALDEVNKEISDD